MAWTVVPKDSKVDQPAVPKVQSASTWETGGGGDKNFRGGPNTSLEFGLGVLLLLLLRESKYYVTVQRYQKGKNSS